MTLEKQINSDLNKIDECSFHSKELVNCAYLLKDMARKVNIKTNISRQLNYEIFLYKHLKYKPDDLIINNYCDNYEYNLKVARMFFKVNFESDSNNYSTVFTRNSSIKYANDFFKQYDKDIYDYFEDFILSKKMYFLRKGLEDFDGYTIEANDIITPYIFIKDKENIDDPLTIAHEIIHAYLSDITKKYSEMDRYFLNSKNFNEVYSYFIELLMLDYFEKININNDDIYNNFAEINISTLNFLHDYYTLLKTGVNLKKEKDVSLYFEIESIVYGRILAYHFYQNYLKDSEETKDNILNFMLDYQNDKKYMLNNYGLDEDKVRSSKLLLKYMTCR